MTNLSYIQSIVGKDNFYVDKAHLLAYSYDATQNKYLPDAVVYPRCEDDISKILKFCNQNRIKVTPRGAGSGFSGGALSVEGGIILSLEKHFNKILEIDRVNLLARVGPAVLNKTLQNEVEKFDLFYPPDPGSEDFSTIGGNVCENAGGMRAIKYGTTKDYVLSLRAVLPNGNIIRAGKKTLKDVAGYNVAGILLASEGTLAVISEITLRLIPKPKFTKSGIVNFKSIEDAISCACNILSSGIVPTAMEFLDDLTLRAMKDTRFIDSNARACIIFKIDSNLEIEKEILNLQRHFLDSKCINFNDTKTKEDEDSLWKLRRSASQSMFFYGKKKLNEDITVPRSNLIFLLQKIKELGAKYKLDIPCFGHVGDGNIHVNVMVKDPTNKDELSKANECIEELLKATIDLEGTLSGEHGIGISKAAFMPLAFSNEELNLFRSIKKAFDPNWILNPGKMGL